MSIPSYPKVWAFGSKVPVNPFDGKPAVLQEKVDGSQFSFGNIGADGDPILMRSKGKVQTNDEHDKMFATALASVHDRAIDLPPGLLFRGEYLQKPKHNTLTYDRVPTGNIVIFDVEQNDGLGWFHLEPDDARREAEGIGLEYVPTWQATINSADELLAELERESFLGGPQIEGVVLKRYDLLVPQFSSPLFCKYVSERFKEVHRTDWKNRNPSGKDFMGTLADTYRTEARWDKAAQHLRERGELQELPNDIGPLMKEVAFDVLAECEDEIKDALFEHWWKTYGSRGVTRGLPEWWKERLLRDTFEEAA